MKVSVVIPAYNEEKYIGRTLESVKNLELKDHKLEILVIDGDSTDRTAEIAKSYGAKVKHEPHKSIGFARQEGIKHAKGEIILFTDADTVVPKNWLLTHTENLLKSGVSCTYGTFRVVDGKFPYFHYTNYFQPYVLWLYHHILNWQIAAGQNIAFWREKALEIGGFDENLLFAEDMDFAIRMKKTGKVLFLKDCIVLSSGRRSNEGLKYFLRAGFSTLQFFLGIRKLKGFPDYR